MSIEISEVAIRKVEGAEKKQWPSVLLTSAHEDRNYWESHAWLVDVRLHLPCGEQIFATWCIRGHDRNAARAVNWAVRARAAAMDVRFVEVFDVRPPIAPDSQRIIEQANKETKEALKKKTEILFDEETGTLFDAETG